MNDTPPSVALAIIAGMSASIMPYLRQIAFELKRHNDREDKK